jgi:HSP20 family protein
VTNKSWFPTWGDRGRDVEQFRGFKTQIDSLFEDWFGRSMGGVLAPRVDVTEEHNAVTLTAELPGVKESDIDVLLSGDQLTIKGEKHSQHDAKEEMEGHTIHRTERSYGAFQRTLTLPYRVNPAEVSAQFEDGVLTITLPKPADAIAQKQGTNIAVTKPARESPVGS